MSNSNTRRSPRKPCTGTAEFFGLPNEYFDPEVGAKLYHRYITEYLEAERVGFDAMVLNEHHANPACMSNVMGVEASILAYASKRARIVLLGSPLPIMKNPLRAAEELAMIDMISGGRLVPGIIRGAAWEQVASNTNPAFNRELFDEAHDFLVQAWTRPGPWRYEGKHFHYRFVNPWAKPLQKKPQIWIPGVISPETVGVGRRASLSLHRARDRDIGNGAYVESLRRDRRADGIPDRTGEFRLFPEADRRRQR